MDSNESSFKQSGEDKAAEAEASELVVEQGSQPDTIVIGTRNPKKAWDANATREHVPAEPLPGELKQKGVA